jgi:NADPH:quinone reductase-like Zn-dependent oxidoreductase
MPKAARLSAYGGIDQVTIVDVPKPEPAAGQIVVRVVAAGTNPGEISIREGYLKDQYPKAFPFGQGTDFAGRVDSVGAGVTAYTVGDEVVGWSEERSAQADYVVSEPARLIPKPVTLDWYRGGSLFVVAATAVAAVRAVALNAGDVVAISGAAGGVGSLAVQLARRTGARVLGIAGPDNAWAIGCARLHRRELTRSSTCSAAGTSISRLNSAFARSESTRSSTLRR